jgi:aspartate dehydrogenase
VFQSFSIAQHRHCKRQNDQQNCRDCSVISGDTEMPNVAVIGYGAMAKYVAENLRGSDWTFSHCIARLGREDVARVQLGHSVKVINSVEDFGALPDLVVDCAGHAGLIEHAAKILRQGVPVLTVSLSALADHAIHASMTDAAQHGGTQLFLASGAIGGLNALSAAKIGGLDTVTYTGINPQPVGGDRPQKPASIWTI